MNNTSDRKYAPTPEEIKKSERRRAEAARVRLKRRQIMEQIHKNAWWYGLPRRTGNALSAAGYTSKDEVRQSILDKKLKLHGSKSINNVGKIGFDLIRQWCGGLPPEQLEPRHIKHLITFLEKIGYKVIKPKP